MAGAVQENLVVGTRRLKLCSQHDVSRHNGANVAWRGGMNVREMRIIGKFVVAACLTLALSALGHHARAQAAQATPATTITMVEYTYSPKVTTVAAGAVVVWRNGGKENHTATVPGEWDTGSVAPGAEARLTFDKPGTYRYVCQFHGGPTGAGMNGTLVVTEAPAPAPPPASPAPTTPPLPPVGGAGVPHAALLAVALGCVLLGLRLRTAR